MPTIIKKPRRITNIDTQIFNTILRARRSLPVKQIALKTNITWPTAKTHIQKLERLKVLRVESTIRKNRVSVHPNFINIMKKRKRLF